MPTKHFHLNGQNREFSKTKVQQKGLRPVRMVFSPIDWNVYIHVGFQKTPKNSYQNLFLSGYLYDECYIVFYRDEKQTQVVHFH